MVEKLSVDNCQHETIYCREIDIRMTCLTFELRVNQKNFEFLPRIQILYAKFTMLVNPSRLNDISEISFIQREMLVTNIF